MDNSILTSIKKLLGIAEDYDYFDMDIVIDINTVLLTLTQLGIGPKDGFELVGKEEKWSDYLGESKNLLAVRSYIYLKVRLLFDPPATSFAIEAMERQISELEWRLNAQVEGGTT